jgi:hypothetical protein
MRARRDTTFVAVLAVAAAILLITARADARPLRLDRLPSGWHRVDRPLTDVLIPTQVFAAATFPLDLHHPPGRCGPPPAVLARMSAGGVLMQVVEYPPRDLEGRPLRVPALPRRPARFRWSDAEWGPFECAGPSFKFTYRQSGRALQAQVWLHPRTVDTDLRAGALRILDNLR